MFKFITKHEFWNILDSGCLSQISYYPDHRLKTVEDAVIWKLLMDSKGLVIGEIGGGNSRVLPVLAKTNTCLNIDKFEGTGNGPTEIEAQTNIKNVLCDLGNFCEELEDSSFDILFSISVVEHIPSKNLKALFNDSIRLLKPGGKLIHIIDTALKDSSCDNSNEAGRILEIASFMNNDKLRPVEKPEITTPEQIHFETSYASNPDHIMKGWMDKNRARRKIYESIQACCYILASEKPIP